ncbi:Arm DNA-binding domain-containing protein [Lacticaseibacillus saniviri]|uniref:Arm DNA-binding domain-containing protein n=1 Tax=Lacticaseibacillus saniviri TaxID=931533 RepID=UPI000A4ABD5D|nr:Arm DNA-binding domain-containing protein [Lacticaseibacillus saniviri]
MASIKKYKLKSGIEKWYFQVFAGKNPKTGKKNIIMRRGFNSEEEARKEAIILESEVIRGTASVVGRQIKIAQYLNDWITKYKKNVKEGTMIIYRYNLKKYIIPQIGEFILSKYTLREHQDFIDSLLDQGLSINTVKLINGTVSNAMKKQSLLVTLSEIQQLASNSTNHRSITIRRSYISGIRTKLIPSLQPPKRSVSLCGSPSF